MMEIKLTMINVQTPVKTRDAKMVFSKKVKNVMMEMKLTTMNAPTPVLFQSVATVFFNKLKTRSAMMETK